MALLLRHPDMFRAAVAWDAPLMMHTVGNYGSSDIFGTQANFQGYRIDKLLAAKADRLQKEKRLMLFGYGKFRVEHQLAHSLMDRLKIAHEYRDGPKREHN